ncbi:DoxX family protein [Pseudoroseicyclus sp. CXY001]|uniref:DoxX family protein n=1 Tax=Pseudoroseicyclus sp. CXY001 TaxID=3242492 RepID=UPI00358DCFF9
MTFLSRYRPQLLSILRIMTALLILQHGTTKFFDLPPSGMAAPVFSIIGIAGILELVGGVLLLIGLFTRVTAFVLSGMMAVAYFMVHAPQGFYPLVNGGELAVIYCFTCLYLAAAGAGPWSVDAARAR